MFLKKYRRYKLILQGALLVNTFLIFTGIVAAINFYKTTSIPSAHMAVVALGICIFGIILPIILMYKIEVYLKEQEVRTQKLISQWVSVWVEAQSFDSESDDIFADPYFWLNLSLMALENLEIKNPVFQFAAEMAPMIRKALKDRKKQSKKKQ